MYIDALESVFSNSSKVMVDVEGGNNMMYLPLDRLTERREPVQIDQDAVRQATEELRREINNAANRSTSNRSRSGN